MNNQGPYELRIREVEVAIDEKGSREAIVTFEGRMGLQSTRHPIKSDEFSDLFDCCRLIAKSIFAKEFRLNSAVDLDFNLTREDGITVWHTQPSTFLKMPLTMNMHWSCSHMKNNYKSMTTLGVVEMPSEFRLVNGSLPVNELLRLMLQSMESGIEFMGMLVLQRDQLDHDKAMAASKA